MNITQDSECVRYMKERGIEYPFLVTRERFDEYIRKRKFIDGPATEIFTRPVYYYQKVGRQRWGILNNGRGVYCELDEDDNKLARKLVEGETEPLPDLRALFAH